MSLRRLALAATLAIALCVTAVIVNMQETRTDYAQCDIKVNGRDCCVVKYVNEVIDVYVRWDVVTIMPSGGGGNATNATIMIVPPRPIRINVGVDVCKNRPCGDPLAEVLAVHGCAREWRDVEQSGERRYACTITMPGKYYFCLWIGNRSRYEKCVDVTVVKRPSCPSYAVGVESKDVHVNETFSLSVYVEPGRDVAGAAVKLVVENTFIARPLRVVEGDLGRPVC